MAWGINTPPWDFNCGRTSWGTNREVAEAFANKLHKNLRGKNVMYFADGQYMQSYGLVIAKWINLSAHVLESGCSTKETNSHLYTVKSALGHQYITVQKNEDGSTYGKFPTEEMFGTVIKLELLRKPFGFRDTDSELMQNVWSSLNNSISLYKNAEVADSDLQDEHGNVYQIATPAYTYSYGGYRFTVVKYKRMWKTTIFGVNRVFKTLKDYKRFIDIYTHMFHVYEGDVLEFIKHNKKHAHYDLVIDQLGKLEKWLDGVCYG